MLPTVDNQAVLHATDVRIGGPVSSADGLSNELCLAGPAVDLRSAYTVEFIKTDEIDTFMQVLAQPRRDT